MQPKAAFSYEHFLWTAGAAALLGGSAFGIKWFYHCVAKGLWHTDRRWWRVFTPPLSSVVGVVVALITLQGDISKALLAPAADVAVRGDLFVDTLIHAFLGGYFSDSAIAKLQEMARRLLGSESNGQGRSEDKQLPAPSQTPPSLERADADGRGVPGDGDDDDDSVETPKPGARS